MIKLTTCHIQTDLVGWYIDLSIHQLTVTPLFNNVFIFRLHGLFQESPSSWSSVHSCFVNKWDAGPLNLGRRRSLFGARGAWEEEEECGLRLPYRCKPNERWIPRTSSGLNYCSSVILHVKVTKLFVYSLFFLSFKGQNLKLFGFFDPKQANFTFCVTSV